MRGIPVIDACDEVMLKVDRPKGLIRYASENSIQKGVQKLMTTRVKAYSLVLIVLILGFVSLIATREDLEATVTRFPGMTYQMRDNGTVSNLYQITLINKTFQEQSVNLQSLSEDVSVELVGTSNLVLQPQSKVEGRFFLVKNQTKVSVPQEKVNLSLIHEGEEIDQINTSFMAPVAKKQ